MSSLISYQKQSQEDGQIDLIIVFRQLWENKWLIFIIMMITLSLGVFFSLRKVPQYQAEMLIQIKSGQQSNELLARLSRGMNGGVSQNDSEATQIALIKSSFILVPVVRALGLNIGVVPKNFFLKKILSSTSDKIKVTRFDVSPQYINQPFTLIIGPKNKFDLYNSANNILLRGEIGKLAKSKDGAVQLLIGSVDANAGTKFSIKKLSDYIIAETLRRQLKIADLGENRQNTGVLVLSLTHPIPKTAVDILNSIGRTIQAKDIQKNAIEASKTLEFLYQQLPITKEDLAKAESALNYYRSKNGKINIKLQSEYLLKQLTEVEKQLGELRVDSIDKLQRYTVEHPLMLGMNTKMRELNIERHKLELQLKKLPDSDQIALNFLREVKVKEALYKELLKKIQELQLVKAGIVSNVRILSFAKLPYEPLPLRRSLIYVASLFLGFMLSLMIIFARKLIFPRIADPHWSERHFDLINLAIIPYSKDQLCNLRSLKSGASASIQLLAHTNPRSLSVESLRSLRTTLQIKLSCETNNIVSILGVSPGVGKTFVSANLAYLLATAGKRVVVIDTDMRRGTLHKYYNAQPVPGLSEVLTNKKTLTEVIKPTVHNNLMVIPRGTYPEDPSELLTSAYFKDLLSTLSQQFDIVLIDTPPVLLVTDAVLISIHAGTNYLVMGANTHQPIEIEISIKRLSSAGIIVNGTIFNFQKQVSGQNSYTHKYGAYYDDKENATQ